MEPEQEPSPFDDVLAHISVSELVADMERAESLFKAACPDTGVWELVKPALEIIRADMRRKGYGCR